MARLARAMRVGSGRSAASSSSPAAMVGRGRVPGARGEFCSFYRRARLRGEAHNVWGWSIWPGRGRRQATASGDAGGRAGAWRGRVAPGQVACGAWQVEDEPGQRGFEQNQGRAGPFGCSQGGFTLPEYGRRERRERCWQRQSRK